MMTETASYVLMNRGWTLTRSLHDNGVYKTEVIELVPSKDDRDILPPGARFRWWFDDDVAENKAIEDLAVIVLRNLERAHAAKATWHSGQAALCKKSLEKFS